MSDMTIVFTILGVAVVLFATNKIAVEIVAIGVALSLAATGVLDIDQALAGFGDRTVIFIAALFVVSTALEATGVTTWAGQRLIGMAGDDTRKLLVYTMLLSAALTSIISVNGAVAALVPMVVVVAVRLGLPTSQLMMPLAFAAHAGSMLALTGTPVNVLISEAADGAGAGRFNFFEFALVGVPLLAIVVVLTSALGPRLLPMRTPTTLPPDLSAHARTLELAYLQHGDVVRYDVTSANSVVGRSAQDVVDLLPEDVELVGVETDDGLSLPDSVDVGDVVIVRGPTVAIDGVESATGLQRAAHPFIVDPDLVGKRVGVVEVVVPPRSDFIGTEAFPGMVTPSGDLVVLAIQRRGQDLGPRAMTLEAGDVLLVQGDWQALEREIDADNEVLAVDTPQQVKSQAVPLGPRSTTALIITGAMVVLLATGVVPAAVAALVAASAIVALGVLTPNEAYRGISWTTVFLVAGMIPLSTAMEVSGAAAWAADILVDLADGSNPRVLLFGVFVLSAVIGSVISNTATALIVIPIALSAAADLGIAAQPVMMAVGVSTSAAFLLPITTPANLMVMGPGGYRFNDYWKFGLPILIVYGLMVVFYLPLVWPL